VVWCGVVWCGVVWCGVVWCGVVWYGVLWCVVVWDYHRLTALFPSKVVVSELKYLCQYTFEVTFSVLLVNKFEVFMLLYFAKLYPCHFRFRKKFLNSKIGAFALLRFYAFRSYKSFYRIFIFIIGEAWTHENLSRVTTFLREEGNLRIDSITALLTVR
jgi:hypothetical protein